MRRCAFLTLAERGDFVIDDEHAYSPLAELGWHVDTIPWNLPDVDWSLYDIVIIRSTWDYQLQPEHFLDVLRRIESCDTILANSSAIAQWNLKKTYLAELQRRGVVIVPSVFGDSLAAGELVELFDRLAANEIVIKPQIGHTSQGAYRLRADRVSDAHTEAERYYAATPYLAQPFARSILSAGEYSLFYFNGEYSHAISKRPKPADFRSQEEHGGDIQPVEAEGELRAAGRRAIDVIGEKLLYARADFVRSNHDDEFWLMELELIEPALYFRMDTESPHRFARAVAEQVGLRTGD